MSLLKSIEADEAELAKQLEAEEAARNKKPAAKEEDEDDAPGEDDNEGADQDDDNEDEKAKKAKKTEDDEGADQDDEDPSKKTLKLSDTEAARLRIKKKLEKEAEGKKPVTPAEPAAKKPAAEPVKKEEAKKPTVEEELAELKQRETQREQREAAVALQREAIQEFNDIEASFTKEIPDYEPASDFMINAMKDGVMKAFPAMTERQAEVHVAKQILSIGGQAVRAGHNPAEYLYNMAYEKYGYKPNAGKKEQINKKVENMKVAEKNKKRSASGFSNGGQNGNSKISSEEGAKMGLGAFSQLSEKEMDELIAEASA